MTYRETVWILAAFLPSTFDEKKPRTDLYLDVKMESSTCQLHCINDDYWVTIIDGVIYFVPSTLAQLYLSYTRKEESAEYLDFRFYQGRISVRRILRRVDYFENNRLWLVAIFVRLMTH